MCKKIIVSQHCKSSTDWKAEEGRGWLCTSPEILRTMNFFNGASEDVQTTVKSFSRQNRFQLLYYTFKSSEGNKNMLVSKISNLQTHERAVMSIPSMAPLQQRQWPYDPSFPSQGELLCSTAA